MKKILIIVFLNLFIIIFNVNSQEVKEIKKKYSVSNSEINFLHDISLYNLDGSINVVVEIPSGSIEKWEVNQEGSEIVLNLKVNNFRHINYLGYPANYGFIPKTLLPYEANGDGDSIDVLIIGNQLQTGQIVRCNVIGMLEMNDQNLIDNKILCIEKNSKAIKANSIDDIRKVAPGMLEIIEIWFKNYKGETMEIIKYSKKNIARKFISDGNNYYLKSIKKN